MSCMTEVNNRVAPSMGIIFTISVYDRRFPSWIFHLGSTLSSNYGVGAMWIKSKGGNSILLNFLYFSVHLRTSTYFSILLRTSMYFYVLLCTSSYFFVLLGTSAYFY